MLPPQTAHLLQEGGDWLWPGTADEPCVGAKFHSPTPLFTHPVALVPTQWEPYPSAARGRLVYLCGTCRDNLAMLHQILYRHNGEVDWAVRREFGNELRRLANQGWALFSRTKVRDRA